VTDTTAAGFAGKVVWITGGAGGFGAGVARRLAGAGASVVVSDIDTAGGEKVAAEVAGEFVRCDVRALEDNRAAVDAVLSRHGRLDIAFLNAGVATAMGLGEDFTVERYRLAMGVNLDGVVYGMHEALRAMAGRGGDIIATASLAGLVATPFDPIYGANKHAVVGLVRAAGAASTAQGVRINAICPGFADTNIVSSEAREAIASLGIPLLRVDEVVDAVVAVLGSGRSGECWYIQPGRVSEPFRFRGVPGPRDGGGAPVQAGEVGAALAERSAH
jgi:NAD(P)-dependent dehydrogenase (short-subunit alcohol dehydrogenase family)